MGDAINRFSRPHEKDPDHIAEGSKKDDLIYRQAAITAMANTMHSLPLSKPHSWRWLRALAESALSHVDSAQLDATDINVATKEPEIIRCKDCYWWTKQEDSLQGRCDRYGMYPTGYWYCAAARERRENEVDS